MAPTKKKAAAAGAAAAAAAAAATKPKKTGTKLGKMKVAKATPKKPTKPKKTGLRGLRGVYAEVMAVADAPHKTEADEDQDYSPGKEDEWQDEDEDDEDTDEDDEAVESSGAESEDEGEGGELTAAQKKIKAKLELDPRYVTNRQRALKKHKQIAARINEDGQVWKDMPDEDLGDIIAYDKGGRFRLVADKDGSIVKQRGGIYYDTKTKESFKKVRPLNEMSALPYADGEIPVMATKSGVAGD